MKKYELNQIALYKCRTKRRLAELLLVNLKDLIKLGEMPVYYTFFKDKKDSIDKRKITAPVKKLRSVQKRIFCLLERAIRPVWLISGEKGKCYIDNAAIHKESNYILTVDIKKFFDSCKREYVYRFFVDVMKNSSDVACILTDLTTYDGKIPTGTSTSQLLAFYAYINMFEEIKMLAESFNYKFSLYVDDMTFSSTDDMKWRVFISKIDIILKKYGHSLSQKKIKYYSKRKPKIITGVVINRNHNLCIPNKLQMKIIREFKKMKIVERPLSDNNKKLLLQCQQVSGMVASARSIKRTSFPEINRITNSKLRRIIKEINEINKNRKRYK